MKSLDTLTRKEKSLLLYLETCCVDYCGAYEPARVNDDDREILEQWTATGFVSSGRITSGTWPSKMRCCWVELSADAWALAHEERCARFERMAEKRRWLKTSEPGFDTLPVEVA